MKMSLCLRSPLRMRILLKRTFLMALAQDKSGAALAGEAWDYWRRKLQPVPPALTPQKEDDFVGSKVDFEVGELTIYDLYIYTSSEERLI